MIIGGKAQSLQKLEKASFKVPPFFICDASWSAEDIMLTLNQKLPRTKYYAVRSSAEVEDGGTKSYAGHFYSAIAVKKDDVPEKVMEVITSYGNHAGSVIIQEFIPSGVSGVAFSDNGEGIVVINSNFGLCKNVVEGMTCDEYLIDSNGVLIRKTISKHKPVLSFQNGALCETESSKPSLSQVQIKQVFELAKKSEKFFKTPQDIEWCFDDQTLYLLQSRPITKNIAMPEQVYFDSANIAESYSGVVLPLTASFAQRVYKTVYTDFLNKSGVPENILKKHAYVFENLLGFFHGRMYYNMNNWYRMAQFVPGYKRNKENFETMITSNLRQEIATTIRPSPLLKATYPIIVLIKVMLFGITEKKFYKYVLANIKDLRKTDFKSLTLDECRVLFNYLESDLLRKWYITLENDFFVMTYLGILQGLYPENNLQELLYIKSKATQQVSHLALLSKQMQSVPEVWSTILNKDAKLFEKILRDRPELKDSYEKYIEEFGGRFANELKLETVGIDEDIRKFMAVLQAYSRYVPNNTEGGNIVEVKLPFFKKRLFEYALNRFKKYASQRENFRLLRSNMFSITRSIFRRVGTILKEDQRLASSDDVFYMTVEEVLALASGSEVPDILSKISERKLNFSNYLKHTPPSHFLALGNEITDEAKQTDSDSLTVRGVSAGVVSGRVKVMKEFEMLDKVDFEILVTKHTDPGWTALIALTKGLIIEHGGVLSHASIVARELGIPAVIGARGATDFYKDGQKVEINGSTGTIRIL